MVDDNTVRAFAALFTGFSSAYGTSKGGWIHSPPTMDVFSRHLAGLEGIGIGPLMPDNKCWFAAIDLDRPDFDLAKEMMMLLPGTSWLERSRSGNAHVLVFFSSPIEAWVVRGIMRNVLVALGQKTVEIFPKSDFLHPGMVGNYLNLPYFGDTRPVIAGKNAWLSVIRDGRFSLKEFVTVATNRRNDSASWRMRAHYLNVPSPEERKQSQNREFGTASTLHICAQHLIEHRDDNPVVEGHRASVYFALAKMLANWSEIDDDEAVNLMTLVNDSSPDPFSSEELARIYENVLRGEYVSTGCTDPLFEPYRHPDCKIT